MLEGAIDNLICPEDVDASFPAPIGISNLDVCSTHTAGEILSLPNGNGNSASFNAIVLQTADPESPVLYTSGSFYGYEADGNGTNGSTLYVYKAGGAWGTLYNDRSDRYLLSTFYEVWDLKGHAWPVTTTGANAVLTCTDRSDHPVAAMYTATVYDTFGVTIGQTNSDAAGVAAVNIPAAGNYLITIEYHSLCGLPERQLSVVVAIGGAAQNSPVSPTVLRPLKFSNFPYVLERSDLFRMNVCGLLLTCIIPEIYRGGSIQAGKIISSTAPQSSYQSYLYSLKKKYLGDLSNGCYGMWFPTGHEWDMQTETSNFNKNVLFSSSVVNMYIVYYTSPSGAISTLDVQLKADAWIDYTTQDTTIPSTPGIVFVDDWLTALSALEAMFIFTENPLHEKIREVWRKALDFMRSGHPAAEALKMAGALAVKGLPLVLTAAGLL